MRHHGFDDIKTRIGAVKKEDRFDSPRELHWTRGDKGIWLTLKRTKLLAGNPLPCTVK